MLGLQGSANHWLTPPFRFEISRVGQIVGGCLAAKRRLFLVRRHRIRADRLLLVRSLSLRDQ
jgi:hypothetical protein